MVDVIRLHGDPHSQAQTLLPWYANGTLNAEETAAVEAHLEDCAECRFDLGTERALAAALAKLPADAERSRSASDAGSEPAPPLRLAAEPRRAGSLLRRPVSLGAALAAQAAMLVVVVGLAWSTVPQGGATYRALGSAPAAAPGNIIVIFRPTASEQELRAALTQSGARVVDGPTASDAFVLRVAPAERTAALARLKANRQVMMAEPIDPDDSR